MKKKLLILLTFVTILVLLILSLVALQNLNAYPKIPSQRTEFHKIVGINESQITTVNNNLSNPKQIYVGTNKFLYSSDDNGKSWETITTVRAYINCIEIDSDENIYVGTDKGLFQKLNSETHWELIYSGKEGRAKNVSAIAKNTKNILIGTKGGLFMSIDNGLIWDRVAALNDMQANALLIIPNEEGKYYAATEKGLYKSDGNLNSWGRIFGVRNQEVDEIVNTEDIEGNEYEELKMSSDKISSIVFSPAKKIIYIGTQNGVFQSTTNAKNWIRLSTQGLLSKVINKLVISSDDVLYAATNNGLFKFSFDNNSWEQIYKGLSSSEINGIAINSENEVMLVATSRGLFKSNLSSTYKNESLSAVLRNFSNEPTISEIQKQAIIYGEVHPDKINNWRKLAAKKALLPKLTADADRYVTDLVHWDSGANPDVLLKGDDVVQWGVSLTWDFGNLIWNSDQTSIDTRSRLMVQLRQDILDEINRLYFERRRMQLALIKSPPEGEMQRMEKELRIDELTADLDALTGGYFSRNIQKPNGELE
ncbi:MAG: hypothetical protein AB1629_04510 [Candidatus Omnitrophota bacterium]